MIPRPENPIVVALDVSDIDRAETLARSLEGRVGMFKIGLELFAAHGPAAVLRLRDYGPIFLDLKLHDIPNTVERAARNCARMGVAMISVHALGGEAMMRAAVRGAAQGSAGTDSPAPLVAGVTVLSSLSGEELASSASLAFEAKASGAGAVVVSGEDVRVVREVVGDAFVVVVPGIRPAGSNGHDQVRILTPEEALEAGADYLVIGRAITDSPDLAATAESILAAIR
jgi:orotidine-5'-phosphate decarboxylase